MKILNNQTASQVIQLLEKGKEIKVYRKTSETGLTVPLETDKHLIPYLITFSGNWTVEIYEQQINLTARQIREALNGKVYSIDGKLNVDTVLNILGFSRDEE